MKIEQASLLVVDDNEMNRDMLSRRLERRGYTVTIAENGKQALELIEQHGFDLVLLDIMMPDIDGFEVLRIVRQTYSATELPIIMVTGKDASKDVVEALEAGANDYVTKPIDFPVVFARTQTHLSLKRAEEARRQSEERYALAVRGARDGLWDWNLKTKEIYYSPRWKEMLGYEENEIGNHPDEWFNRVHPDDVESIKTAIATHLQGGTSYYDSEYRILHKDGRYCWMLSRGAALWDKSGNPYRFAGSQTDITEGKVADALTGLPNRILFMDRLERIIEHSKRNKNHLFALMLLDLDRFKTINDSLGHQIGDQLLIQLSRRLESATRKEDIIMRLDGGPLVARLGGDAFLILLDGIKHESDPVRVAERIQKELTMPFNLSGHQVFTTASIGIVLSTAATYRHPENSWARLK